MRSSCGLGLAVLVMLGLGLSTGCRSVAPSGLSAREVVLPLRESGSSGGADVKPAKPAAKPEKEVKPAQATKPANDGKSEKGAPPAPVVAAKPARPPEAAKLRPGLVISFSLLVAGKEEFGDMTKRISDAGTMVLPLLGTVTAKDLTLEQLSKELTVRYSQYYVNPQVIVDFVRDTGGEGISPWGYVTVLGRVKDPGRISLPATRDLTVSGAIQKAGGFSTSARVEGILVTRRKADGEVDSREVNLKEVGTGGRVEEDLVLQEDDVVFVPELRF